MPDPRRPHASEEGPTLLFQRTHDDASDRCVGCPFRHVPPDTRTPQHYNAAILPIPPIHGPGAALPVRAPPAATSPATLPRPALLARVDARGSETLVLPDALKPAGPEAATVARPVHSGAAAAPRPAPHLDGRAGYDELASPDITIVQVATPAPRPTPRPRQVRPPPDARAYFVLNLCLGVLIVAGLAVLVSRELMPTSGLLPTGDAHDRR